MRAWRRAFVRLSERAGQGTVEYALALFGLLAVFAACGALWRVLENGLLVSHAVAGASHHLGGRVAEAVADVLLF